LHIPNGCKIFAFKEKNSFNWGKVSYLIILYF
jgi:hypothetical protein